ncbi:MAG: TonB-dependent receptor [Candidatus Symbiothrix sp.]|jgi:TonB-linked SusC/RagA family outer membrane protein|nr:TonB-dependent receptor [Candidatus Symbiothrix sp.]
MTKVVNYFDKSIHSLRRILIAVVITAFSLPAFSQQNVEIKGRIVDTGTHEPIIGADISVAKEKAGAASNVEGKFSLTVKSLPATLSVRYLGYKTLEVDVYEYTEPLIISLQEDRNLLNEVVVVGYGTQKRKELTGSIATVSKVSLEQQATSLDKLLGGAVAGLTVTETSGQPGSTSNIRIRGEGSISANNEPLFIVDGFILHNSATATSTNLGGTTSGVGGAGISGGSIDGGLNPLTSINPADIESIDVLKDISATAIYGAQGANGVILITTKKGKRGKSTINYSASLGIQNVSKNLNLLNADQWADLYAETTGKSPYDPSQPYNLGGSRLLPQGQTADWQGEVFQQAYSQNHNISISGGGEDYRYLVSGNYTDQEGIVRNTDLKRYVGRINFDKDVFKNFKIGTNLSVSRTTQRGLSNTGFSTAVRTSPLMKIYDPTTDDGFNYYNPFDASDNRIGDKSVNPVSDLVKSTIITNNLAVVGNFFAEWQIIPQLSARLNAGTNISHATQNYYAPATSAKGLLIGGYAAIGGKDWVSTSVDFLLNYKEHFNEIHYVDVTGGYTHETTNVESSTFGSSGFKNEALTYHSVQSGEKQGTPISGGYEDYGHSFFGRVNYTLLERYNLTASLRADGSSNFPKGHQWGVFPSLGLSWNVEEESFFTQGTVSSLKVRASAGQVGNKDITAYAYSRQYTPRNYSFGNKIVVGYTGTNYGNPDLKWETTSQYNAGADLGFLNNRLNVTLDAYYKYTSDLLVTVPIERTTGYRNKLTNLGNISNKGLEFSVNATLIERRNFHWTASANISKNINRIEKLESPSTNGAVRLTEGQSLGTFYGYVFDGIIQPNEVATAPQPTWTKPNQAGDIKYANYAGDPNKIDEDDKVILGSIQPKFTYGFQSQAKYKQFDLSVALSGSYGNKLYNALRLSLETPSSSQNGSAVLADRWTPNHTNTNVPRASLLAYTTLDSRYIEDASYLRLRDVTFGYNFKIPVAERSRLLARVFVTGQNLLTVTDYQGYDPEAERGGQGTDNGAYPKSKTVLFGLNVTF